MSKFWLLIILEIIKNIFTIILLGFLPLTYIIFGVVFLSNNNYNDISICENLWIYILLSLTGIGTLYIISMIKLINEYFYDYLKIESKFSYFIIIILILIWCGLIAWGFIIFIKIQNDINCMNILKNNHKGLYVYLICNIVHNIIILVIYFILLLCQRFTKK